MNQLRKRSFAAVLVLALAIIVAGCASQTNYEGAVNFVEPKTVGELMGQDNVVVVDVRDAEAYSRGHLDGALHLSPGELTISEPVSGLVAPKETFEAVMNKTGIANEDMVLIYDDKGGIYSARLWWVMKLYGHEDVRIINQGAKGLEMAGLKMSADVPSAKTVNYQAKDANKAIYASLEEAKAAAEGESQAKIIDVRSKAEYDEGAIPGATLYSHTENLYNDGSFKSGRTIELNYKELGFKKDDELILYCKTSVRAAQTAALLMEAGYTNVKVYDGAWLEWESQGMPSEESAPAVAPSQQDAS